MMINEELITLLLRGRHTGLLYISCLTQKTEQYRTMVVAESLLLGSLFRYIILFRLKQFLVREKQHRVFTYEYLDGVVSKYY